MLHEFLAKDAPDVLKAREYEQYIRRSFFEGIVAGQLSRQQILETAEQLDLDLRAEYYTIVFVSAVPEQQEMPEAAARIRDNLVGHFLKYPEYLLFRWDVFTYAVIIKGDEEMMDGLIQRCISTVLEQYRTTDSERSWYIAVGRPVGQLTELPVCFEDVSRLWAYRHILPAQHILTEETVNFLIGAGELYDLTQLDAGRLNPTEISTFLKNGRASEVAGFVDEYLRGLEGALTSGPFCQYLMLSIRFAAAEFVNSLQISQREYLGSLNCPDPVGQYVTKEDLKRYLSALLTGAIELRDGASENKGSSLLGDAIRYVDANYTSSGISLNRVAGEVKVSPNYFSAVFRAGTGSTFVEYLTAKRMEKARQLLRFTQLRCADVALAVGYRDSHYFSTLFRKTQGCTPREYRARKNE